METDDKKNMMSKLCIVTPNKKNITIRVVSFVLAITPIILSIVLNIKTSLYTNVLNSTSFVFFLIWLYTIYFVKSFSVIGSVEFHTDYLTTIIPANSFSEAVAYSDINQLVFYYNDTKGDNYSGSYAGFGALRTKDGINNYIDINGRRYQVEIESKAKLILVQNTLDILLKKGVSVKIYE